MNAYILVFCHDSSGLREIFRYVQGLSEVNGRRREPRAQILFLAIPRDGEALDRANVNAGIALDTAFGGKVRLDVAIEAARHFFGDLVRRETEFHFDGELVEAFFQIDMRHFLASDRRVIIAIAPLADSHFLTDQVHPERRPVRHSISMAIVVDRNGGLMTVLDRPDNILWPKSSVAAEEHAGPGGLICGGIDYGRIPFIEIDSQIAFYPREGVLLTDGQDHVIGGQEYRASCLRIPRASIPYELIKLHAFDNAILDDEFFRRMIDKNFNLLLLGILELPGGCFEKFARAPGHDFDVLTAEATRR